MNLLIFLACTAAVFVGSLYVSQLRDAVRLQSGGSFETTPWYAEIATVVAWLSGLMLLGFLIQKEIRPYLGWTFVTSGVAAMLLTEDKENKDTEEKTKQTPAKKLRSTARAFALAAALFSGGLYVLSAFFGSGNSSDPCESGVWIRC